MRAMLVLLLGSSLIAACGGGTVEEPEEQPPSVWENKAPLLHVASPGALSIGESLEIIGQDFIQPEHGSPKVQIKGNYSDEEGGTQAVEIEEKPDCIRSGTMACGKLRWRLWPDIRFDRTGDHLGYFQGTIVVVNEGNDGSKMASEPLSVRIDVKPSLLPRMIKPKDGNCQNRVSLTLEDTPFVFSVEAIGMRPATEDSHLTFSWAFMAEQWNVNFSYVSTDPNSIVPKTGVLMLIDEVKSGLTSTVQEESNLLLKVGSDVIGPGVQRIASLKTGKLPEAGDDMLTTVNVSVVDGSGKSLSLSIPLKVSRSGTLVYDGNSQLAERFPPVKVSDCMPGGDYGRNASYSEDKSESRSRSMSFNWNVGLSVSVGASAGLKVLGVGVDVSFRTDFSTGFGVDTSQSINSSASSGTNLSGQILPGQYGVFYRQTSKWYRVGKLVGHNVCGNTFDLGDAVLTDWTFTPELATGTKCVPPSQLPEAGKFVADPTSSS